MENEIYLSVNIIECNLNIGIDSPLFYSKYTGKTTTY